MARAIDADIIIKDLTAMKRVYDAIELDGMIKALKEAPTIEAEPVKHGEWKVDGIWDRCSVCNRLVLQPHINGNGTFYYCPNCGADMRDYKEER